MTKNDTEKADKGGRPSWSRKNSLRARNKLTRLDVEFDADLRVQLNRLARQSNNTFTGYLDYVLWRHVNERLSAGNSENSSD